jgi:uncharacterized protein (TIGR02594 family)
MYKVILSIVIAAAIYAVPVTTEAKPTSTTTEASKKVIKKTKAKKQKQVRHKKIVATTTPVLTQDVSYYDDSTSHGFFAIDAINKQKSYVNHVSNVETTVQNKRNQIRQNCGMFNCSNKVIAEAKKWEGKSAKGDRHELKNMMATGNKAPIDPVRIPWCAAFANAILVRSGYETSGSLMARSFLQYGVVTKDPKIGDIVVTTRGRNRYAGHVGFFDGFEYFEGVKYVKVFGGNTAKSVQVGYFPINKVLGYRTPT